VDQSHGVFYTSFKVCVVSELRAENTEANLDVLVYVYNIFDGTSYTDSDVDRYIIIWKLLDYVFDRFCGLVVRVSGHRSRGPGFDSRRFQVFWEAVGLKRGPLSSGLENRD
jgi:hypothetical protein